MELLAPVGSKEGFITALRAGADAVYAGVPGFNARAAAKALNLHDLRVMIDYAHEKGAKVYLALNTLIKHAEINDVVRTLTAVDSMHPDAIIVQDLGVAGIIRSCFPDLELHASTQMAVHNRAGVDFLAASGFKRAILARELSFPELKAVAAGAPIGIEIFCHGALCFSVSGMCLFSSYIGGQSGNRGRCTQPCRRIWHNGEKRGYLFSPRDLELAEHIPQFKKIGVSSLKIEGRMRTSGYVYHAVKAYRLLLDAAPEEFERALGEARKLLANDMARPKTTCLYFGRDEAMFEPTKAQCLGNRIGSVAAVAGDVIAVSLLEDATEITAGDRLRIANPETDVSQVVTVHEFGSDGAQVMFKCPGADAFVKGNPVFRTIDTVFDPKDIEKEIDGIYADFKKAGKGGAYGTVSQGYTSLISNTWRDAKKAAALRTTDDVLWVRFDDIAWLEQLPAPGKNDRRVLWLTRDNLHAAHALPQAQAAGLTVELTPFIGQRELPLFKQAVDALAGAGVRSWVLNNPGHFELVAGMTCELTAGQFLYTWNAYTAALLHSRGVTRYTVSWEDDFANIQKMCGPGLGRFLVVYLYGAVPAVRSRLVTREMLSDDPVVSDRTAGAGNREAFLPYFEAGLTVLTPERPFAVFDMRDRLREFGIGEFGIDLTRVKPGRQAWEEIIHAYRTGRNPANSSEFNFDRGVR